METKIKHELSKDEIIDAVKAKYPELDDCKNFSFLVKENFYKTGVLDGVQQYGITPVFDKLIVEN